MLLEKLEFDGWVYVFKTINYDFFLILIMSS